MVGFYIIIGTVISVILFYINKKLPEKIPSKKTKFKEAELIPFKKRKEER